MYRDLKQRIMDLSDYKEFIFTGITETPIKKCMNNNTIYQKLKQMSHLKEY